MIPIRLIIVLNVMWTQGSLSRVYGLLNCWIQGSLSRVGLYGLLITSVSLKINGGIRLIVGYMISNQYTLH